MRHRERFQRLADLVELEDVVDARVEDDGASVRVDPDQPFCLQLRERLSDRGRADPEALRHVVLSQPRPGGERAVLDLLAETLRHHLRGGVSSRACPVGTP